MFEFLCTDLKKDDPDFQILGEFSRFLVPVPETGPYARHLFVSKNAQAEDEARKLGMGVLHHTGSLNGGDIESLLASYDPSLTDVHKLFLFDMGKVVVNNISMLGKISRLLGIEKQAFIADYLHYEFPLMEGVLTEQEYWRHVEHLFHIKVKGNPFADAFSPTFNEPMVALIEALRSEGHRVVCASNTILSHWKILAGMGALDLFDNTYASHEMGLSKPSLQFYTTILASEDVSAEQVFFIDDRKDNIHTSRSLGIASLLYADLLSGTKDERLYRIFRTYLHRP